MPRRREQVQGSLCIASSEDDGEGEVVLKMYAEIYMKNNLLDRWPTLDAAACFKGRHLLRSPTPHDHVEEASLLGQITWHRTRGSTFVSNIQTMFLCKLAVRRGHH